MGACSVQNVCSSCTQYQLLLSIMYTGDDNSDDSSLFICEQYALTELLDGLKTPCTCGMAKNPWTLDSTIQVSLNF